MIRKKNKLIVETDIHKKFSQNIDEILLLTNIVIINSDIILKNESNLEKTYPCICNIIDSFSKLGFKYSKDSILEHQGFIYNKIIKVVFVDIVSTTEYYLDDLLSLTLLR